VIVLSPFGFSLILFFLQSLLPPGRVRWLVFADFFFPTAVLVPPYELAGGETCAVVIVESFGVIFSSEVS